jgi:hypothetical protein
VTVELDKQVHSGINERWRHRFLLRDKLSCLQVMPMTDSPAAATVEDSSFHKFG